MNSSLELISNESVLKNEINKPILKNLYREVKNEDVKNSPLISNSFINFCLVLTCLSFSLFVSREDSLFRLGKIKTGFLNSQIGNDSCFGLSYEVAGLILLIIMNPFQLWKSVSRFYYLMVEKRLSGSFKRYFFFELLRKSLITLFFELLHPYYVLRNLLTDRFYQYLGIHDPNRSFIKNLGINLSFFFLFLVIYQTIDIISNPKENLKDLRSIYHLKKTKENLKDFYYLLAGTLISFLSLEIKFYGTELDKQEENSSNDLKNFVSLTNHILIISGLFLTTQQGSEFFKKISSEEILKLMPVLDRTWNIDQRIENKTCLNNSVLRFVAEVLFNYCFVFYFFYSFAVILVGITDWIYGVTFEKATKKVMKRLFLNLNFSPFVILFFLIMSGSILKNMKIFEGLTPDLFKNIYFKKWIQLPRDCLVTGGVVYYVIFYLYVLEEIMLELSFKKIEGAETLYYGFYACRIFVILTIPLLASDLFVLANDFLFKTVSFLISYSLPFFAERGFTFLFRLLIIMIETELIVNLIFKNLQDYLIIFSEESNSLEQQSPWRTIYTRDLIDFKPIFNSVSFFLQMKNLSLSHHLSNRAHGKSFSSFTNFQKLTDKVSSEKFIRSTYTKDVIPVLDTLFVPVLIYFFYIVRKYFKKRSEQKPYEKAAFILSKVNLNRLLDQISASELHHKDEIYLKIRKRLIVNLLKIKETSSLNVNKVQHEIELMMNKLKINQEPSNLFNKFFNQIRIKRILINFLFLELKKSMRYQKNKISSESDCFEELMLEVDCQNRLEVIKRTFETELKTKDVKEKKKIIDFSESYAIGLIKDE